MGIFLLGKPLRYWLKAVLFLALIFVPVILFMALGSLEMKLLAKTPLYTTPLKITHMWKAGDIQDIKGNDLKEGDIVIIFDLKNDPQKIFAKLNMNVSEEGDKEAVRKEVDRQLSYSVIDQDMVKAVLSPEGYNKAIVVKGGVLNTAGAVINFILKVLLAAFLAMLYVPIARRIGKFIKYGI